MKPASQYRVLWVRIRTLFKRLGAKLLATKPRASQAHPLLRRNQQTMRFVRTETSSCDRPVRIVRLLAVAMWPHGALTHDLELPDDLDMEEVKKRLRRLGWVYFHSFPVSVNSKTRVFQFNFSDSLKHGFMYSEYSFNSAVKEVVKQLSRGDKWMGGMEDN
jgi:hypothetical protein